MAQTQTRTIRIIADTKGDAQFKKMANMLSDINKQTRSLSQGFGKLQGVFAGLIGYFGVREFMDMADGLQQTRDRLKIFTGSAEAAEQTLKGLQATAASTRTSLSDLGNVYNRLAAATKESGVNSEQLLLITKTLQNSFRLSGSTTGEATSASVQLAQGLASGELRGQELRSVLEANVVVGGLLAKQFGVTRGELYKLAEAGKLTADKVMVALLEGSREVNAQADQLSQTFGQTLTVSMDRVAQSADKLNQKWGLNSKFASGMAFLADNLETIIKLLGSALFTAAFVKAGLVIAGWLTKLTMTTQGVGLLTVALTKLQVASLTIAGPLAAVGAIVAAGVFWADDIVAAFKSEPIRNFTSEAEEGHKRAIQRMKELRGETDKLADSRSKLNSREKIFATGIFPEINAALDPFAQQPKFSPKDLLMKKDDYSNIRNLAPKKEMSQADQLKALAAEYRKTGMSVEEFARRLESIKKVDAVTALKEARKEIFDLNQEARDNAIYTLNEDLREGQISLSMYDNAVKQISLQKLNDELRLGIINLKEYNEELLKLGELSAFDSFQAGIGQYLDSLGTMSQAIANTTENAFGHLEDAMYDFITKGKQDWKDFANNILADINRMIVRMMIVQPIADAALNFASGLGSSDTLSGTEGRVTRGGQTLINPNAQGGIVSTATSLGYGPHGMNVAGEAGTEAILPLRRLGNGDLGVQASSSNVTININNMASDTKVTEQESTGPNGEKQINILIENVVKEGIAKGTFDRSMSTNYGLKRKGS